MATILVVDDDAFLRQLATGLLRKDGHSVVTAASAEEALAVLADGPLPDVLLLDIELPDMSGLDLLDQIKDRLTCPVILMSGNALDGSALPPGVVDYVVKPFPPTALAARVAAVLAG